LEANLKASQTTSFPRFTDGAYSAERIGVTLWNLFIRRTEGQDLLEYAILTSLVAVLMVGVVTSVGGKVSNLFVQADASLDRAGAPGSGSGGDNPGAGDPGGGNGGGSGGSGGGSGGSGGGSGGSGGGSGGSGGGGGGRGGGK
jgi:Flp pilus assembly pilin Flp